VLTALLDSLFANSGKKPSKAEVARVYNGFLDGYVEVINNETGELYDPKEYQSITERTISNYLSSWESKIGTFPLRSNDRQKLMGQFKPYHSFSRPEYAGSIISVDDRQPPFCYAPGQRVWFYNAIDLGSEAFTCWVWGKDKKGIILEFYRQMLRNYTEWGICLPAEIEAESNLNSSFVHTFLREGAMFDHVRIEANNARGKRIERYNRDLRYSYEKDLEGWMARPHALDETNQPGRIEAPIRDYNEIVEQSLQIIEKWNNMPHPVHTDKTRWEVFLEKQHPALKPTNWKAILPYLGYSTKSSCNNGIINLNNGKFLLGDNGKIARGQKLIDMMEEVEGRELIIYWLDDNCGEVMKAIIFAGGVCIGEAIPKPDPNKATIERTAGDYDMYAEMSAYVSTIEGYMRSRKGNIEQVTVLDNRPTTLNNKFKMPGLRQYEQTADRHTPEILPDLPADDTDEKYIPATSKKFTKSTKDRL
jgi:hypothetical protein